ncbi:MAG: MATE family efflux transporter [Clostridia bacterium]|nr:MATE family efflux transporter [Clostridia bacterium]
MEASKSADKQYKFMTETPVGALIIKLGIPTTISMLITNIYNMADTYFVGTLGTSASGAVGIVFGLMAVIQAVGFMLGHGAGSIISRKLGAKDTETANYVASTSFFTSLIAGLVITVFGLLFSTPFLRLLGSTDTILPYAKDYALWILLAAPITMTSFVLNNILRYEGKAALAMIGLTTGGILNIFGDFLLIRVFDMGIQGAGISTAVSQLISFFILLSMFLRGKTQSRLSFDCFKNGVKNLPSICSTGFPSLMRQGLSSVSTMLLNNAAGLYGDAAVAGMTIVNRICFFIFAVGLGIGQGFQPVCSFNYGAKKFKRVKKGFFFTWGVGEVLLSILAVVGLLLSDHLVGIFRDDPLVIEIGSFALKAQLIALFFQPLSICSNMMFQSIGKNKTATFLSALRSGFVFIPVLLISSRLIGLTGIQISQTITDVITFIISFPFMVAFFKNMKKDEISEC